MNKISIIVIILSSTFLLGCSETKVFDSKTEIKNPNTSVNVQDNRPRPFPAGVK